MTTVLTTTLTTVATRATPTTMLCCRQNACSYPLPRPGSVGVTGSRSVISTTVPYVGFGRRSHSKADPACCSYTDSYDGENIQQPAQTFQQPIAPAQTVSQICHNQVRIRRVNGGRLEMILFGKDGSGVIARQPNSAHVRLGSSDKAGDPPAIRRVEKISERNGGSSIATRERASRQDA